MYPTIEPTKNFNKNLTVEVRKAKNFFYKLHDIDVNQKYGKSLPYSFHLGSVAQQMFKLRQIMFTHWGYSLPDPNKVINNTNDVTVDDSESPNVFLTNNNYFSLMLVGCYGHDSIEDGRLTWNDVVAQLTRLGFIKEHAVFIADLIFCVTDEKGKSRKERKNNKFFDELWENENAIILKFADMLANLLQTITFDYEGVQFKRVEFFHFVSEMPKPLHIKYEPIIQHFDSLFKANSY